MLKSINRGVYWEKKNIDINVTLDQIKFIDESTGWMSVYRGNFLLKTEDGGENWVTQSIDSPAIINSIFFIDQNIGWAVGDYHEGNNTFKTINGGDIWTSVNIGSIKNLSSVYFVDENTGWISEGSRYILKTTDGGESWSFQRNAPSNGFNCLYFIDSNTGWAAGNGIFKTTTGGDVSVKEKDKHSYNIPEKNIFFQNYPNPFNLSTIIYFYLSKPGFIKLKIYDILGREIETLVNRQLQVGEYRIPWRAENLSCGIYLCHLQGTGFHETRKLILIK